MATEGTPTVYGIAELATRIERPAEQVEGWFQEGKLPAHQALAIGPVWVGAEVEEWIAQEVDVAARARNASEAAIRRAMELKLKPRAWQVAGNVAGAAARGLDYDGWVAEGVDPAAKRLAEGQDTEVVEALRGAELWPWS